MPNQPLNSTRRDLEDSNKFLQWLGIPYSALASVIFGMMILSFPIGAYVVFNSEVGEVINFEYPIDGFDFFSDGVDYQLPFDLELGDVFIVFWCGFLILFSISIFGPKKDFFKTLSLLLTEGKYLLGTNYLSCAIKWFCILVLVSGIINFVQESIGFTITPPEPGNRLIQFVDVTTAPIIEEVAFRVLLIGLPLFAIYSSRTSIKHFFQCLWNPLANLKIASSQKPLFLIIFVSILFGFAHIIFGESWSTGKFTQAAASGLIIGWVYFRNGLVPALIIHWATNYFIFSYVFFIADINSLPIQESFSASLLNSFEIMFILAGILSSLLIYINYKNSKKEKELEI